MYKRKLIKGGVDPVTIATTGALATVGAATAATGGDTSCLQIKKEK